VDININLDEDLVSNSPSNSFHLHLVILCGALKYCLGRSNSMSYIKLSYIFENTIALKSDAFKSKLTFRPWRIDGYFRDSIIKAESMGYIKFIQDAKMGIKISNTTLGNSYLSEIEVLNTFSSYRNYLNKITLNENKLAKPIIRCEINEDK